LSEVLCPVPCCGGVFELVCTQDANMSQAPPPLLALFGSPTDCDAARTSLDDELRRLAHAEWLRTGNQDAFCNWTEAEKQLGWRLLHTGTVQWLYEELSARDGQLAETVAQARELEASCADLEESAASAGRLRGSDTQLHEACDALSSTESRLAARESLLQGELAAEQAKLAACESKIRALEPTVEEQSATLARRNRHLAECDSCIQSLKVTLKRQQDEMHARADLEAHCEGLETALEEKQAELKLSNEELSQQDSRISGMEAWLGARRDDLDRGFQQLAAQRQELQSWHECQIQRADESHEASSSLMSQVSELEAALATRRTELAERDEQLVESTDRLRSLEDRLESQCSPLAEPRISDGLKAQALENTVRSLESEVAERDNMLSIERTQVTKLEAIEARLRRELASCATPLELQRERKGPEVTAHLEGLRASSDFNREERVFHHEELLVRDKRLAHQESQTQALNTLLMARRAELEARGSQMEALQTQLAARERRIKEQDARALNLHEQRAEMSAQLQTYFSELATSRAELEERDAELATRNAECRLHEERAAEMFESQCECIAGLESQVREHDRERAEQLATERALVAHCTRLRESEVSLAEACQQNSQLQAQPCNLSDQRLHDGGLEESCRTLEVELEAETSRRKASDEQLRVSEACNEELSVSLRLHREELIVSEAGKLAHEPEIIAVCSSCEEHLAAFETSPQALSPKQLQADGGCRLQEANQLDQCLARNGQRNRGGLSKLEERMAMCLAKVRRAADDVAEARQVASDKRRYRQGVAQSFLTIYGINYALLTSKPMVLAKVRRMLQQMIALEAGLGVTPEDVTLELSDGSVVVCATIRVPPGASGASIEARLVSSKMLCRVLADQLAQVEGIEPVCVGDLSVVAHKDRPAPRAGSSSGNPAPELSHGGFRGAQEASLPSLHGAEPEPLEPSPRRITREVPLLTPRASWSGQFRLGTAHQGTLHERLYKLGAKSASTSRLSAYLTPSTRTSTPDEARSPLYAWVS